MWILGNGESRNQININLLQEAKIGCNAIHRDYSVDHLICVDRRMVNEATSSNISPIYTRQRWLSYFPKDTVRAVPELPYQGDLRADDPFHWGSGPYAVLLGCLLSNELKLLGFDLYSKDKKVNNVYKGTHGYVDKDYREVDPRYWIHQIGKLIEIYQNKKFVIYQDLDWELPKAWNYPNVTLDKISNISYNT
jgi:hypothetical protein